MTETRRADPPPLEHPSLERVAVALDTSDPDAFGSWCGLFGPRVGALKVGLEAFYRWGHEAVREARASARRLFLDLKLHDIPNTVRGGVASAADLGADLLTVHASGGRAMLEAAVEAAGDRLGILAVTLLTHLDENDLTDLDLPGEAPGRVRRWAGLARHAGCHGVVCSPREVGLLRRDHPEGFELVTPGIRFRSAGTSSPADDQRRVATPAQALREGADLLVVGRPLTRAEDPLSALSVLAAELEE